MRVALSTIGKFHTFDLARQLFERHLLSGIFSGYPRFRLRDEGIPEQLIHTYPYLHAPYMAMAGRDLIPSQLLQPWEYLDRICFDRHVATRLPECEVFVGLSGSSLTTGRSAKRNGARVVCDRGSSHIRTQATLLKEEHQRWGMAFDGTDHTDIDARIVERELAEYEQADAITVPSTFAKVSFIDQKVDPAKVHVAPYGVDLSLFVPTCTPETGALHILYVGNTSLRKGIPYLLEAYRALKHPKKTLTLIGHCPQGFIRSMHQHGLWSDDIRLIGHVAKAELKHIMSASHALVLPSVEDGFGLVMAEAMACGCPVLATTHTGAQDLYTHGQEGFIIPIQDSATMVGCLQQWADMPALHDRMRHSALARVAHLGGWQSYGTRVVNIYKELVN